MKKLYKELSNLTVARLNSIESNNHEWIDRHESAIEEIVKNSLPCGSGFDNGTTFDFEKSNRDFIFFAKRIRFFSQNRQSQRYINKQKIFP